jgi:hypothetical protein
VEDHGFPFIGNGDLDAVDRVAGQEHNRVREPGVRIRPRPCGTSVSGWLLETRLLLVSRL